MYPVSGLKGWLEMSRNLVGSWQPLVCGCHTTRSCQSRYHMGLQIRLIPGIGVWNRLQTTPKPIGTDSNPTNCKMDSETTKNIYGFWMICGSIVQKVTPRQSKAWHGQPYAHRFVHLVCVIVLMVGGQAGEWTPPLKWNKVQIFVASPSKNVSHPSYPPKQKSSR